MKIGVLRETLKQSDQRVALPPFYARKLLDQYPEIQIKVQPSDTRIFSDEEYYAFGIELAEDLSDCDILLGVKEVDIETIIPNKTYLFFAHVAKKQVYHRQYFKQLAEKKITLLDYEYFTNKTGKRVLAFGYWAGIVGTYNTICSIGKKYNQFDLPPITSISNYAQLINQLNTVVLPPVKIVLTGNGKTASGTIEILKKLGIKRVKPKAIISENFEEPVFSQLNTFDYIHRNGNFPFQKNEFYRNPKKFRSIFNNYAKNADVYISCHYWNHQFPNYLTSSDLISSECKLKIVSDISCDINGPIACTIRDSKLENPFYDFNPITSQEEEPFSQFSNITVMAVDNLPSALPREASMSFAKNLTEKVIPLLLGKDDNQMLKHATILNNGKLTKQFFYLYNFLNF